MNKKIGLVLLALVVTLGVGVGISLAQDHGPDEYVALRAHLANTGCPYVTLEDGTTETAFWFPADPDLSGPQGQVYNTTSHTFEMNNLYPGFGYYYAQGAEPCDEPPYILYFVRNQDMDDTSEIGAINVDVYTLDGATPVPCSWIEVETYDSILTDIEADVAAKIDALGVSPFVADAMETAFAHGSIQEGDVLQAAGYGQGDPDTWGCYGLWIRVPFEDIPGAVPMSEAAYISITIDPPSGAFADFGPYFVQSPGSTDE